MCLLRIFFLLYLVHFHYNARKVLLDISWASPLSPRHQKLLLPLSVLEQKFVANITNVRCRSWFSFKSVHINQSEKLLCILQVPSVIKNKNLPCRSFKIGSEKQHEFFFLKQQFCLVMFQDFMLYFCEGKRLVYEMLLWDNKSGLLNNIILGSFFLPFSYFILFTITYFHMFHQFINTYNPASHNTCRL